MKAVTLRNLSPDVARAILQRARERRTSVNRAVSSLLEERLGVVARKPPARHHDLDALAGAWSRAEAAAFDRALAKQRAVDVDLWR